jgi:hypothetical protein
MRIASTSGGMSVVVYKAAGLARLDLARAYVLFGDPAKAKTACQDFLALWKDADQVFIAPAPTDAWRHHPAREPNPPVRAE